MSSSRICPERRRRSFRGPSPPVWKVRHSHGFNARPTCSRQISPDYRYSINRRVRSNFVRDPVFAHVLLVDEINRAMPKSQSALLEAMAEKQVTVEGVTRRLEEPFLVMATENPIEQEGTFPLPEAQLDRFAAKLALGYPSLDDEVRIVEEQRHAHPLESVEPVVTGRELMDIRLAAERVYIDPIVLRWLVELVRATRHLDQVERRCVGKSESRARARCARVGSRARSELRRPGGCRAPVHPGGRSPAGLRAVRARRRGNGLGWVLAGLCPGRVPQAGAAAPGEAGRGRDGSRRGLRSPRLARRGGPAASRVSARLRHRMTGVTYGSQRSLRRGQGAEIAGSRRYVPGDRLAWIDWHASARESLARDEDVFIVRQYFEEVAPRVIVVVDRRPSMALYSGEFPWLSKPLVLREASTAIVAAAHAARAYVGYLDFTAAPGGDGAAPHWISPHRQSAQRIVDRLGREFDAPRNSLELAIDYLLDASPRRPGQKLRLHPVGLPRAGPGSRVVACASATMGRRSGYRPGSGLGAELPAPFRRARAVRQPGDRQDGLRSAQLSRGARAAALQRGAAASPDQRLPAARVRSGAPRHESSPTRSIWPSSAGRPGGARGGSARDEAATRAPGRRGDVRGHCTGAGRSTVERAPITVETSLSPRSIYFADVVSARVDVFVDRRQVDPASIQTSIPFGRWKQLRPVRSATESDSSFVHRTWWFTIACFAQSCVPRVKSVQAAVLPKLTVSGRTTSGTTVEVRQPWPVLNVATRFAPPAVHALVNLKTNRSVPAATFRISPTRLSLVFTVVGGLLVAGGLGLGVVEFVRRRGTGRTVVDRRPSLVRSLELVAQGRERRGRGTATRCRSSGPRPARGRSRPRWSRLGGRLVGPDPSPDELEELARRVEAQFEESL